MASSPQPEMDLLTGLAAVREMFDHAEAGEDPEKVVRAFLRSCLAIFPATGASLVLGGKPATKYFLTRARYQTGANSVGKERLPEPRGLAGLVLRESRAMAVGVSEARESFDVPTDGIPGVEAPEHILLTPLDPEPRPVGCVSLLFRQEPPSADLMLGWLSQLAATASQALRQRSSFERLRRLSTTDDLTGAYNYRYLLDGLQREIRRAGRFQQVFSVVMLDVDHLKEYNDVHGHLAGSRLLASFARIVQGQLRSVDTMAKYGGDEFVVILPQTGKQGAGVVADRIRLAIESHTFPGEVRKITTSLGISSFPEDGDQTETLLGRADQALYRAKKTGRNRVCAMGED